MIWFSGRFARVPRHVSDASTRVRSLCRKLPRLVMLRDQGWSIFESFILKTWFCKLPFQVWCLSFSRFLCSLGRISTHSQSFSIRTLCL